MRQFFAMQLVLLAGELGEKYGKRHEYYNLQTPADAIKLLCINYPALKQDMVQAHHNGVGYKVIQGGAAMGYDELRLPFGSKPLLVVPVISGAGGGSTTSILLGVGLVATAILTGGTSLAFGAGGFGLASGVTATTALGLSAAAGNIGVALILGGTASLISPQPQLNNAGANRIRGEGTNVRGPGPDGITRGAMGHENYAFTGPANTVGTGATVPVIYGRVIAGSHLIAANLEVSDDSDPLKITTQAPGIETLRVNGDAISGEFEKAGGLLTRRKGEDTGKLYKSNDTNKHFRIVMNKTFGKEVFNTKGTARLTVGDTKAIEPDKNFKNESLEYSTVKTIKLGGEEGLRRKNLDIIFRLDNGLFDYVSGEGTTKIDGFIRYRITAQLTGKGDADPTVASADVTLQGLLLRGHKVNYGHRLQMPEVPDREKVRIKVEIIDAAVHDGASLHINAYGYGLLGPKD